MKWVHELLINTNNDINSSEIKKNLFRYFLNNYFNSYWPTIGETAKKCFVSESVVTNFAKGLGFSGYREFIFKAREESKNFNNLNNNEFINKNYKSLFKNIANYFDGIDKQINQLIKILRTSKCIYIINSEMLKNYILDFYNLLIMNNINCILLCDDRSLSSVRNKIDDVNDLLIFFISSFESTSSIEKYQYLKNKIQKTVVICDESKEEYFDIFLLKLILPNSDHKNIYEKISNLYMLYNLLDSKLKSPS